MQVRIVQATAYQNAGTLRRLDVGAIVDLPDGLATHFIKAGYAETPDDPKAEDRKPRRRGKNAELAV